jgi:hypothetical protein
MTRLLLACALVWVLAPCLALAEELCATCRDKSHTKDIGTCVECKGMTTSGEYKLCMACAKKLGQCQECRKPLEAKPVEATPSPASPAPAASPSPANPPASPASPEPRSAPAR